MAREPVTQDGYSVDRTTAIEVDLQLICSGSIVYLRFIQCVRPKLWHPPKKISKCRNECSLHFQHRSTCCLRLSSPRESCCRKVLWRKQTLCTGNVQSTWVMLGETNNDYIHQYYLFDNTHLSLAHLCSEQEPKRRMGGRETHRSRK